MAEPGPPDRTPFEAFVDRYWKDRDEGTVRALEEYLRLYPGDQIAIAREFLVLEGGDDRHAAPAESDRIGPYRTIRELGRGGHGVVYLAEDTRLHRKVALKVLIGFGPASEQILRRFHREAEVASKLDHPGICAVFDAGIASGTAYIAMRYVEGESLARRISCAQSAQVEGNTTVRSATDGDDTASEPLAPPPTPTGPRTERDINAFLLLIQKAALALHAAHEAGIIHRDIKPGNIMLSVAGDPVILDFGLAREIDGDITTLTLSGDLFGTPAYMSPEQLLAHRVRLDRRTDVYSLGITLYECLAFRRPFDAPTRDGLYQQIQTKPPPDLRTLNSAVSQDLRTVVETAIAKDRDHRYQTALDLAEDLRRVREREPILARPVGRWTKLVRWAQRNRALAASLAAAALFLIAGLAGTLAFAARASARLEDWERLADDRQVEDLVREAATDLWPAVPELAPRLRAWIERARGLVDRLAGHREAQARFGGGPADFRDAFQAARLSALVGALEDLTGPAAAGQVTIAGMEERLRFAETLEAMTLEVPAGRWKSAIAGIAEEPLYRGLRIVPQMGLVPLGADKASRLWEFAETGTGSVPERDADGHLAVSEETGLVFVLVPGGTFLMGAQVDDEKKPNFDELSQKREWPSHEVAVRPFFLSKYEMTQAQWERFTGGNPSQYRDVAGRRSQFQPFTRDMPVENVSWTDSLEVLRKLDLVLPSEADWEYACRAGTDTPWWTGKKASTLEGAANVLDATAMDARVPWGEGDRGLLDGWVYHAPVGSFRANAFGLHDMHGNVDEWCRDGFTQGSASGYDPDVSPDDEGADSPFRVYRGGSFYTHPSAARSSHRGSIDPAEHNATIGVRPARPLVTP